VSVCKNKESAPERERESEREREVEWRSETREFVVVYERMWE